MKKETKNYKKSKSTNLYFIIASIILLIGVGYYASNIETNKAIEISMDFAGNLIIKKVEISEKVSFYPYKDGDTYMEVLTVKASDGTIRTALNTCQICFDSGRGYYLQQGDTVVCQNCGNVFKIDDIEKVKNGCNPVPVMDENKIEDGEIITIAKEFLSENREFFINWKK